MTQLELILNGKSAARPDVRAAVLKLREEGVPIHVHVTWEGGDAYRYARQFTAVATCVVVAGGGDGTVNEVLNGLLDTGPCDCRFAILPLGTANDFATSAGIPTADPYQALALAARAPARRIDVGRMNGRHFLNVASGGFGAEVTTHTPLALKKAIGGSAYALEALLMAMKSSANPGRLVTPEKSYEGSIVMFAVGNGRLAGGGIHMTPDAVIDDGLFDITLIPDHPDDRFTGLVRDLAHLRLNSHAGFHHLRASSLRIESEKTLQINLDGEPVSGNAFAFDMLPLALQAVLPPDCPLLT